MMTMPLANFDFDGMFHLNDNEEEIPYLGASYLMWILFVIVLAILFLNLLVSLILYSWLLIVYYRILSFSVSLLDPVVSAVNTAYSINWCTLALLHTLLNYNLSYRPV